MSTSQRHLLRFWLPCLLMAAVAAGQMGCSSNFAKEPKADDATAKKGDAGKASSSAAQPATSEKRLNDPLLKKFDEALRAADDIEPSDLKEARKILKEADPLLTRIKEENRRGIEKANRAPKIIRSAPAKKTETKAKPEDKGKPEVKSGGTAASAPEAQNTPATAVPPTGK